MCMNAHMCLKWFPYASIYFSQRHTIYHDIESSLLMSGELALHYVPIYERFPLHICPGCPSSIMSALVSLSWKRLHTVNMTWNIACLFLVVFIRGKLDSNSDRPQTRGGNMRILIAHVTCFIFTIISNFSNPSTKVYYFFSKNLIG